MAELKVKAKLLKGGRFPVYTTEGASGLDLFSREETIIEPKGFKTISTGVILEIPEGYEAQVRPRSGLASKYGIGVLNSPGTIDSDYRGEVKVILFNFGDTPFEIKEGDRIAQLVFNKIVKVELEKAEVLSPTKRGKGGFGHTGR